MIGSETLRSSLPPHLQERICRRSGDLSGEGVVYWMRRGMRLHENPALDAALACARTLQQPLLICQGWSEASPLMSRRLLRWALEGAAELQRACSDLGLSYALQLDSEEGPDTSWLTSLAQEAALVITEELPSGPLEQPAQQLRRVPSVALWTVDSHCVLPAPLVTRRPRSLEDFRRDYAHPRAERLEAPWPALMTDGVRPWEKELPLRAIPDGWDALELCRRWKLPESPGPLLDSPGGVAAAEALWAWAKEEGLRRDPEGVSRLYGPLGGAGASGLHWGFIAPMRIARELAELSGPAAQALLSWLVLEREWAWIHASFTRSAQSEPSPLDPGALPHSLREELLERGALSRPSLALLEDCSRLERDREKQLLRELSQHCCLDGGDPSLTYALETEQILRPPLPAGETQAGASAAPDWLSLPSLRPRPRVAILGAGLAGLSCASALREEGWEPVCVEAAPRVGGQLLPVQHGGSAWDARLPYLSGRGALFRAQLAAWAERGWIAPWEGRFALLDRRGEIREEPLHGARYAGRSGGQGLFSALEESLQVLTGQRVTSLRRDLQGWLLEGPGLSQEGPFDCLLLALPSEQVRALLPEELHPHLPETSDSIRGWSSLIQLDQPAAVDWDGLKILAPEAASWISRESSKPQGGGQERWLIQGRASWCAAARPSEEEARLALTQLLSRLLKRSLEGVEQHMVSWQRRSPAGPEDPGARWWPELGLGLCGESWAGGQAESAWLSGQALAARLLGGSRPRR